LYNKTTVVHSINVTRNITQLEYLPLTSFSNALSKYHILTNTLRLTFVDLYMIKQAYCGTWYTTNHYVTYFSQ